MVAANNKNEQQSHKVQQMQKLLPMLDSARNNNKNIEYWVLSTVIGTWATASVPVPARARSPLIQLSLGVSQQSQNLKQ